MALVQYNDVIEKLAPDSAYPSFGNPVLPGASQRSCFGASAEVLDRFDNPVGEN